MGRHGGRRGHHHHHGGGGRGAAALRVDVSIDPAWKNQWKFGLFDCCSEPALCVSTLPCTCYYWYHEKLAAFLLNDRTFDPNSTGCGFVCCRTCFFDPCWCFFPGACAAQQLARGIQNRYYIGSDVGGDCTVCCRFWFCQACAMTQVIREINHRGEPLGGLGCALNNNNSGNPRAPNAPNILFLNSAEIALESSSFNTQAQAAMQNQTVAGQGNFVANRLLYLATSSSVASMGGLANTGATSRTMALLNPMLLMGAIMQPADLQRYQMYTDMKNIYRQVQETQDGQWNSDQRNRYQGMEQEMLRPRVQQLPTAADPNQMMMGMGMVPPQQMQMGMMQQQHQIQMGMMPQQQQQQQQQQQLGFYSPPPPPPPQGNNNNGWNL